MKKIGNISRDFHNDENGASFLEYTVLIGIGHWLLGQQSNGLRSTRL
jgi:Flp pilus assembly pilin Flp